MGHVYKLLHNWQVWHIKKWNCIGKVQLLLNSIDNLLKDKINELIINDFVCNIPVLQRRCCQRKYMSHVTARKMGTN